MNKEEKQDVFNRVATHLLKQNDKSVCYLNGSAFSQRCAYRGNNGLKCAIGALIDDEYYDPKMEDAGLHSFFFDEDCMIPYKNIILIAGLMSSGIVIEDRHDLDFLQGLQLIHDKYDTNLWHVMLTRFAKDNNLNMVT